MGENISLFRRGKWTVLRAIQFVGFAAILLGAYPIYRPVLSFVLGDLTATDRIVSDFGIPLLILPTAGAAVPSLVYIAVGMIVVWLSTSRRLY